jgi:hypothetical protein
MPSSYFDLKISPKGITTMTVKKNIGAKSIGTSIFKLVKILF